MHSTINGLPYLEAAMYALLTMILVLKLAVGSQAFWEFVFGEGAKTKKEPIHKRISQENHNNSIAR